MSDAIKGFGSIGLRMPAEDKADLYKRNYGRAYAPFVPFITIITICYLICELGFNARLLDVTGGQATHHQVDNIEVWGRCISGVAVTLAIWGMLILPRAYKPNGKRWSVGLVAIVLLFSGAVTIKLVYDNEQRLIDSLVNMSNGTERWAAMQLEAVSTAVLHGSARIDGIDLSSAQMSWPAGKTFLSIFPLVALSTPDLARKTESMLHDAVHRTLDTQAGGAANAYNTLFVPSVATLRNSYRQYRDGCTRYRSALDGIPDQQQQAWQDYLGRLGQHRWSPYNVPNRYWGQVGQDVRGRGVPVPPNWVPMDKESFYAAIAEKVTNQASDKYRSQTKNLAGQVLPSGMSWPQFYTHAAIQKKWQENLGAPEGVVLAPMMGFRAYRDHVYMAALDTQTDAKMKILLRPDVEFADGGPEAVKGRDAMEALLVPPIALGFSLMGALLHIFKVSKFTFDWTRPRARNKLKKVGGVVGAIALSMLVCFNPVSTSPTFNFFQRQTHAFWGIWGWPMALGVRWTVQTQPNFYPLNEWVRVHILRGMSYGYLPPDQRH